MDYSKIKLIVTDMDGTLLNTKHEVSSRFFKQFELLQKYKINFVAASGRQFQSIVEKLEPIKDDIGIIAENGAIAKYKGNKEILLKLEHESVKECIEKIRKINDCYVVLCANKSAYIESSDSTFFETLKQYYSEVQKVDDLTKIENDDFVKIAIYHFNSTEKFVYPHLKHLEKHYQVIVSGLNWLDISHKQANKAYALKLIQDKLNIKPAETLVFGDYNNDLGMLDLAYFSYAMENAHPNVKKTAKFKTKSNDHEGVEYILEKVLKTYL
jgi:Cof subfamily protein (haloacid dehalogenase superfamily)